MNFQIMKLEGIMCPFWLTFNQAEDNYHKITEIQPFNISLMFDCELLSSLRYVTKG